MAKIPDQAGHNKEHGNWLSPILQPCRTIYWIPIIVLGMSGVSTSPLHATNYRCQDERGKPVLTDSPSQLRNCKTIDLTQKPDPIPNPTSVSPSSSQRTYQPPRSSQRRLGSPSPDTREEETEDRKADSELPIAIPLTKIGGSLVVQVLLNGTQSAHLIVDTGATMTVLSYDIGVELGLLSGAGVDLSTVNTAGGSVQVNMTKVDTMQVGEARVENVQVAIHDLPDGISGVSGLLGMSFLKHFTVTLDSSRGFLYLTPRESKK